MNCNYCGTDYDPAADLDALECVASGESICGECRSDHVGSCGACAYEIYEAI